MSGRYADSVQSGIFTDNLVLPGHNITLNSGLDISGEVLGRGDTHTHSTVSSQTLGGRTEVICYISGRIFGFVWGKKVESWYGFGFWRKPGAVSRVWLENCEAC